MKLLLFCTFFTLSFCSPRNGKDYNKIRYNDFNKSVFENKLPDSISGFVYIYHEDSCDPCIEYILDKMKIKSKSSDTIFSVIAFADSNFVSFDYKSFSKLNFIFLDPEKVSPNLFSSQNLLYVREGLVEDRMIPNSGNISNSDFFFSNNK